MNACTQMLHRGKSRERIWWLSGSQESDKVGGGPVSENNSASILKKPLSFFSNAHRFIANPRGLSCLLSMSQRVAYAGVWRGQQVVF